MSIGKRSGVKTCRTMHEEADKAAGAATKRYMNDMEYVRWTPANMRKTGRRSAFGEEYVCKFERSLHRCFNRSC